MVEYLEQLVAQAQWDQALKYAEEMLKQSDNTTRDLAMIQYAITTARYYLGEFHGAITAGELGVELAAQVEEWDWYGAICVNLGTAYYSLGRNDDALEAWFHYLNQVHLYHLAGKFEPNIWYNIAQVYLRHEETAEAIDALSKAVRSAQRQGHHRLEHGLRHALAEVYLKGGVHDLVPELLAQCLNYLHNNQNVDQRRESWLWHLKLRSEFALKTARLRRARMIAVRGLSESGDEAQYLHNFHLILAEVSLTEGNPDFAVNHYLAARACAVVCRRADLEASVSEVIQGLLDRNPGLMESV